MEKIRIAETFGELLDKVDTLEKDIMLRYSELVLIFIQFII